MKFTIFGGQGFIGAALAAWLAAHGYEVSVPERNEIAPGGNLGHVVYAIGLTADFRTRPLEAIEAHTCALIARLRANVYQSWLYLSSTRVYAGLDATQAKETSTLRVRPDDDGTFNLSKLTGEAACLALASTVVRVARVANVYGPGMHDQAFLGMLLADVRAGREVVIGEAPASSKDYLAIGDLCWLLERIALGGRDRLYNAGSGNSVTHGDIAAALGAFPDVRVRFAEGGATRVFPRIDMTRAINEFGYRPRNLLDDLPALVRHERGRLAS